MDTNNKYYDLIAKLVKNHRKYQGYEAIFDEIVSDVYSHAQEVIKTIDNEAVVQAYLQKVVSTSMITVPKRLNFHSELKHKSISVSEVKSTQIPNNVQEINNSDNEVINQSEASMIEMNAYQESEFVEPINAQESQPLDINIVNDDLSNDTHTNDDEFTKSNPELVSKMINSIASDTVSAIANDNNLMSEEESFNDINNDEELISFSSDDVHTEQSDEDYNVDLQLDSELDSNIIDEQNIDADNNSEEELLTANIINNDETENTLNEINDDNEIDLLTLDSETIISESDSELNETDFDEDDSIILSEQNQEESINDDIEELTLENTEEADGDSLEYGSDVDEISFDDDSLTIDAGDDSSIDVIEQNDEIEQITEYEQPNELLDDYEQEQIDIELSDNFEIDELSSSENNSILQEDIINSEEILDSGLSENNDLLPIDDSASLELDIESAAFEDTVTSELSTAEPELLLVQSDEETINEDSNIEEISLDTDSKPAAIEDDTFKSMDYSAFNYTPTVHDSDVNDEHLGEQLLKLNNNRPDLNILKIFDLKYKQNMSISKIAEELQIDKQSVVLALDELIKLV